MKTNIIKATAALFAALAFSAAAFAGPISGAITFTGSVQFDTGSAGTATAVTSWSNTLVQSVDGDLDTFINPGAAVTFVAPWSLNTPNGNPAIDDFWSVGGFAFDLHSSSVVFQTTSFGGFVSVGGSGLVSGNGFDATAGSWTFTSQNPEAGGTFSFSAGTDVPDNGMTALFLGSTLFAMSAWGFRRKSA